VNPYPEVPACASAAVPERANAVATTIVVSFKVVSFLVVDRSQPHHLLDRSIKIFSKRDEAAAAMRFLKPEFSFQKT
jgi:hypothetical protein